MFRTQLYEQVLIEPVANLLANKLYIVSGYATATFTRRHMKNITELSQICEVNLIIGMPRKTFDDLAFKELHSCYPNFKGYYYKSTPPVHCKAYSWFLDETPLAGYSGSANYSQYGFLDHLQMNQMVADNPFEIRELYNHLLNGCIYIPEFKSEPAPIPLVEEGVAPGQIKWIIPDKIVTISFLDIYGNLPETSGLNWGQRREKRVNPKDGSVKWVTREPNQAYLSIKKDSRKEGFFPPTAYTFTLITDDQKSFDCVVAQQGRKAIHSTNDNSELGRYIRNRINVPLGAPVTKQDLIRYGRTDFTIEKLDDETFLFDFSVK